MRLRETEIEPIKTAAKVAEDQRNLLIGSVALAVIISGGLFFVLGRSLGVSPRAAQPYAESMPSRKPAESREQNRYWDPSKPGVPAEKVEVRHLDEYAQWLERQR